MPSPITDNTLYYGDNLFILREYIPSASVDLIYLDPPFNSNRNYNVLFRDESGQDSEAQITAFEDTWHWNQAAEATFHALVTESAIGEMIGAMLTLTGRSQMGAYLVMMAARLIELHRVLKPTGSLYLHCDPTASHYLKMILDGLFGPDKFQNEVVWKRRQGMHNTSRRFGSVTDTILFYSKSDSFTFNKQYGDYDPEYIAKFFKYKDESGRIYRLADLSNPADRPNLKYEYKGYPFPTKGWAVSKERMEQMDKEGRLWFPSDPNGRIQRKRFLVD
jgi:site-specific DNA-methyltransferase (adenine-specific)